MNNLTLEGLPLWVLKQINNPLEMGEGRNNQMIKIGPKLIRLGYTPDQLEEIFRDMYDDLGPAQDREIESVIQNSIKLAAQDGVGCDSKEFKRAKQKAGRIALQTRQQLKPILTNYKWTYDEIRNSGGWADSPLALHRSTFLRAMFEPDDVIWIGDVWHSGDKRPQNANHFRTLQEWLELPAIPWEFVAHSTFQPGSISRCDQSVAERKYLVVESDILSINQIGAVFRWLADLGLPLQAIVSSGRRSLHGWFQWPGDSESEKWEAALEGVGCDVSTIRGPQPVRLPGIVRRNTGRPQELLYLA